VRGFATDRPSWSGDFDGMFERRLVRVAVPYSRSLFYHDRGHERGLTAGLVRKFEEHLNKKHKPDLEKRPITVVVIPTTRDQLIPMLLDGRADIAAGNITITDQRRERVDFSAPISKPFSEIVVTGPGAPALATLDDLAGQEVFVRPATSYFESLTALNERFVAAGKPPMTLTLLPDPIEDEDKLDMVNAGLLGITVVDEWLADLWSPILTNIVGHKDLAVRTGGQVGRAFRKDSPLLQAEVDDFMTNVVKKYGLVTGNVKAFATKLHQLKNAKADKDWERFQQVVELFRKYGTQYHFDYLLLLAQGYQNRSSVKKAQRRRGDRGDAADAGHRQGNEGRRHRQSGTECACGFEIHGPPHGDLLPGCRTRRREPHLVRLRRLQCGTQPRGEIAQGGGRGGLRPQQVVQQCRAGSGEEGRPGARDLRAQHLQVLCLLQVGDRS
jgi:membrane-bound lytic murein transglycosylase MltF